MSKIYYSTHDIKYHVGTIRQYLGITKKLLFNASASYNLSNNIILI